MTTKTQTRTRTCTRIEMIHMSCRLAVMRLLSDPDDVLTRIVDPGLRLGVIHQFHYVALDPKGGCHGQLVLSVDWEEHAIRNRVQGRLALPKGREVPTEVCEMVRVFESIVRDRELKVDFRIVWVPGPRAEQFSKSLGFRPADPLRWVNTPTSVRSDVRDLKELDLLIEVADES